MIVKVESNKDKQSITAVSAMKMRINGKTSWKVTKIKKRVLLETTVQIELPKAGLPSVVRFRFCRFPTTPKADFTGHFSYPVHLGMAGQTVWVTLSHSILATRQMNIAVFIDHNGKSPIILDGRQFKAN